jgi:outer membrane protein assembly factor BamB
VTNGIPLGCALFLPVRTVNCVQTLKAIQASNGVKKWSFKTDGAIIGSPALSPDGASIFFGNADNNLYAVHTADGKRKWVCVAGVGLDSSPAVSVDGATVFIGSYDHNLYAIIA